MEKYKELYRKNKETGKWERLGSPIDTYIFSGNPSNDTEVIVTNPAYRNESGETVNLYNALTQIDERLNKHDGNISYLAEHGGGGGGGGGGGTSNYKIELTNITPVDGYYYSPSSSVTINFRITGGNSSTLFQYRIIYDGVYINGSDYKKIVNRTIATINIPDINAYSQQAPHTFIIDAIDPYGFGIETYTLKISETSVNVKVNTIETLNISDNGRINVTVTNKIMNSETTLVIDNLTVPLETPYTYTYTSKSTNPTTLQIPLIGNVIKPEGVVTGKQYNIQIYAQASIGTTFVESEKVYSKVNFVGGNQVAVVFGNISTDSEYSGGTKSSFATGEPLLFNFSLFYGKGNDKTPIFYAVRLHNPTNEAFISQYPYGILLMGNYFDDNLHQEGKTQYQDNDFVFNGTNKTLSWNIPNNIIYKETEGWVITVRGWAATNTTDTKAMFDIIEGKSNRFGLQIPTRSQQVEKDTLFGQWGNNVNFPTSPSAKICYSHTDAYTYLYEEKESVPKVAMNVYNTNGSVSGFFSEDNKPKLRLQNSAYGMADLSSYQNELRQFTNFSNGGFGLSITFLTDKHPFNDRVVFFMGENDSDGELMSGLKISLEDVYWIIKSNDKKYTLHAKIQQNVVNTIDFILKPFSNSKANVKILINGVINASDNINNYDTDLSSKFYVGCDFHNNQCSKFADVNIYDIKLFSKYVNDLEAVVNGKESKLGNISWTTEVEQDFDNWKKRNFIYTNESTPDIPLSKLFEDGEYKSPNFSTLIGSNPPLPVMLLEAPDIDDGFTKDVFYQIYGESSITGTTYYGFKFSYYDPSLSSAAISTTDVGISLQGTSTLTYKNKNLELKFMKKVDETGNKIEMFQPKKDWMPESQFTLKADVVDSAHANNTTIGTWINSYAGPSILEENPAMLALKENIPLDVYTKEGTTITGETAHNDVKIRHTLEGFPFLLLVKFAKEATATLIGIYSFNMGRYSHYNMGFKFLKSFTRRNEGNNYQDLGCPAIIDEYEINNENLTYVGGTLDQSKICSYEFNSDGDDNTQDHPTWSQDSLTILQHIGEFKYLGGSVDNAWASLQDLFKYTAKCLQKYPFEWRDGNYVQIGESRYVYEGQSTTEELEKRLSLKNAIGYFVIAVALGMVDSLGKNMTLRTWDGIKWYACFYDMDTALELTNSGSEDVDSQVYIDIFKNRCLYTYVDPETHQTVSTEDYRLIPFDDELGVRIPYTESWDKSYSGYRPNEIITYPNLRPDMGKGFGSYNSGLWNLLRDATTFKKDDPRTDKKYYENIWVELRSNIISSENNFVAILQSLMTNCGEMIYNFDYNEKYISSYSSTSVQTEGNISMLHGTRIETIRAWLKDRFIFLDGILAVKETISSLPYYKTGIFYYEGSSGNDEFIFNVSSPIILTVTVGGSSSTTYRYMLKSYTDNKIVMPYMSETSDKDTAINATDIITKIDGLVGSRFQKFGDIKLPSMSGLNIKGTTTLSSNPINFDVVFTKEISGNTTSDIREVVLASTKSLGTYVVDLSSFNKLSKIDISNSNVGSLSLPTAPLMELKVNNSAINGITVQEQPNLKSLDFAGCNKLDSINISNCENLETLYLNNLDNIHSINISVCKNLREIICENNSTLSLLTIDTMEALTKISIKGCSNELLSLKVNGVPNIKTIDMSNTYFESASFISPNDLSGVTYLNLSNCVNLKGFIYSNGGSIEEYEGEKVLDLSPFSSLTSENVVIKNVSSAYIRFKTTQPYVLRNKYFSENSSLKRIFGTFTLSGSSIFASCNEFSIKGGKTDEEEKYQTNFILSTTNITECFADTNCDFKDVKYILGLDGCKNVLYMNGLFRACVNIRTSSIPKDLFNNCINVKNMNSIFSGCANISGYLPSPQYDTSGNMTEGGLMTPLSNLLTFESVFSGNVEIDDHFFWYLSDKTNLKIKTIKGFNPKTHDIEKGNVLNTNNILYYLTDLEEIDSSFNGSSIVFSNKVINENKTNLLFYNTPNLKSIKYSFRGLILSSGMIKNLLGGDDWSVGDTRHFPQALTTFVSSFTLDERDPDSFNSVIYVHINKNFFRKAKNSLIAYGTNNANEDYNTPYYANFYGLKTYFIYNEGFPNEIFNGCSKLEYCVGLFNEIMGADENGYQVTLHNYQAGTDVPFVLPADNMFKDCTSLTTVPYLFSSMKGFGFKLNNSQFVNCKLKNISHIFYDPNSIREGMIPYKLFYQNEGNVITNMENALSNSQSKLLLCYSIDNIETGYTINQETGLFENRNEDIILVNPDFGIEVSSSTHYTWNKYIGDGKNTKIQELYDTVSGLTALDGHKLVPELPNELKLDYIDQNYPGKGIPHIAVSNFYGNLSIIADKDEKMRARQYFCPPDIFKYCVNDFYTNIKNIFNGCGSFNDKAPESERLVKGIYGTICPYLFEPINKIDTLTGVFSNCIFILPHKWDDKGFSGITQDNIEYWKYEGVTYPPTLLTTLTGLTNVNGLFAGLNIWGGTQIDSNMFSSLVKMKNLSSLFGGVYWTWVVHPEGEKQTSLSLFPQLSISSFKNLKELTNVSGLFGGSNGRFYINSDMFTLNNQRLLDNCSNFMNRCYEAEGSVPQFWDFNMYSTHSMSYSKAYASINASTITNYSSIPEEMRI